MVNQSGFADGYSQNQNQENKNGAEFQVTSAHTPMLPAHLTD